MGASVAPMAGRGEPLVVAGAYATAAMASAHEFGSLRHLVRRFFGALSPAGPAAGEEGWACGLLLPGEQLLWRKMSGPDRRHGVDVARQTAALLGEGVQPDRAVMAAALLHDVGKIESGFGTLARAAVTACALVVGRASMTSWAGSPVHDEPGAQAALPARRGQRVQIARRVAMYLTHDQVGGVLLRQAGSDPLTVAWTEEHHLPQHRWTVDPQVAKALKAADGD